MDEKHLRNQIKEESINKSILQKKQDAYAERQMLEETRKQILHEKEKMEVMRLEEKEKLNKIFIENKQKQHMLKKLTEEQKEKDFKDIQL